MKIKEGLVVSKSDLEKWKLAHEEFIKTAGLFQKAIYETSLATINRVIKESQPLEPIIRDAWKSEDNTLDDYINETEI